MGKITTIYADFSDNVGVTEAILFYKAKNGDNWNSVEIINGSADILIPKDSKENRYYYVTVNDAAGNGPIGKPSNDGSKFFTIEVSSPADDLILTIKKSINTAIKSTKITIIRLKSSCLFLFLSINKIYYKIILTSSIKIRK